MEKKKRCISYIFIMDQKTGVKDNILLYDFLAIWYEKIMNGSGTKCFSFGLGPGSNFLILRNEETARERERNRYTETDRQQ